MSKIKNKKQTTLQRIKVLEKMVSLLYLKEKQRELQTNKPKENEND